MVSKLSNKNPQRILIDMKANSRYERKKELIKALITMRGEYFDFINGIIADARKIQPDSVHEKKYNQCKRVERGLKELSEIAEYAYY